MNSLNNNNTVSDPLVEDHPNDINQTTLLLLPNNKNKKTNTVMLNNNNSYSSLRSTASDNTNTPMFWPYQDDELLMSSNNNNTNRRHNHRQNSIVSFLARSRSNTIISIKRNYHKVVRYKHFKKFMGMFIASVVIYIGFTLAFLPRTSLSRDFRRIHFSTKFTKPEIYRVYLDSLQQNHLELKRLSGILYDEKQKKKFNHKFNHLFNDNELTQFTFNYLEDVLHLNPKILKSESLPDTPTTDTISNNNIVVKSELSLWEDGRLVHQTGLQEPCLDETSCNPKALPGYIAFSGNGTIKAQFVYVNHATFQDFQDLVVSNHIAVHGKIHIIKIINEKSMSISSQIRNSINNGAVGCVFFKDDEDDGEVTKSNGYKSYPNGPARNSQAIQRGSIYDGLMMMNKNNNIDIPVISLSYYDVLPILNKLSGVGIPLGSKDVANNNLFYSGPSNKTQLLKIRSFQSDNSIDSVQNIVVNIPGIWKDEEIVVTSQRDSFTVNGFNSGFLIFLEVARGLSKLKENGWKPLRTIKLVSLDGESVGKMGSSSFIQEIGNLKSFIHINLPPDMVSGSQFHCQSNEMLRSLLEEASKSTPYGSVEGNTLFDNWKSWSRINNQKDVEIDELDTDSSSLGFQTLLGVPSVNCKFENNKETDAIYLKNSNYNSKEMMEKFFDPDYKTHSSLSKFVGFLILMGGEREVIYYDYFQFFQKLKTNFLNKFSLTTTNVTRYAHVQNSIIDVMEKLISNSIQLDDYNKLLQEQTIIDYPWYQFYIKMNILFKIKRLNNQLISLRNVFLIMKMKDGFRKNSYQNTYDFISQPNNFKGAKIKMLGKLECLLQLDNQADIEDYLYSMLLKKLLEFNQMIFDDILAYT
ncbi:uncharacterized protein SCODWIG_03611 [Saccharomycodes ludwigii]|uniref:Peptide hydrolase n=1 Tax=Saccharomycodes ludwigii TaxID=36035 RepID=A0A376BCJ5_9ASCO|nr:uncharacterized protein SCODWIG_03611 [Saccharomycodes ludwigii]